MAAPVLADQVSKDSQDQADISVQLKDACGVEINEYALPSGGVIGIGRTGSLFVRTVNVGSFDANIDGADWSIYKENDSGKREYLNLSIQQDLYDDYEPLVDYQNYSAKLSTTGDDSFGRYTKVFTAATDYETGTYKARISFNYTCYRGPGTVPLDGSVNETKEFSLVKSEVEEPQPETPDRLGTTETDQAIPQNFTDESLLEANATNYTKDNAAYEANQTVKEKGNDRQEPGVTAADIVDVEPLNRTNKIYRGRNNNVGFKIQNVGSTYVTDISIEPDFEQLDGWEYESASIENLTAGETLERSISVKPPSDAQLGKEIIPVTASTNNSTVDLDYFYANVLRTELNQSLDIVEAPSSVTLTEDETSRGLPVLIENTGEVKLTNVSAELENYKDCVSYETSNVDELDVNESGSVPIELDAKNVNDCEVNLIVSAKQGAVDFASLDISVTPKDVLIPERQAPPILAIVWTLVLALYAVIRKKLDWESITAEMPLILLIMGETVIILYLSVNYFGFINAPFLPF